MRFAIYLLVVSAVSFLAAVPVSAQSGGLALQSGSLTVASGGRLATAGDLNVAPGAALDATAAGLTFMGMADQVLDTGEALTVAMLRVDKSGGTLTLAHDVSVTGVLDLPTGSVDQNGHLLLLAATVDEGETTHLASLDRSGAVLAEPLAFDRYYRSKRGWRMITAPLTPELFTSLNAAFHTQGAPGADYSGGDPVLYYWDPANTASRWQPVADYSEAFVPGRGYAFFAFDSFAGQPVLPSTWRVRGEEPEGPVVRSLAYNSHISLARFNLLGNPFAAPLDWHEVQAAASLQASYSVWDPAANDGLGNYAVYSTAGIAIGNANRYIPAFQGFWAETSADSPMEISFDQAWKQPHTTPLHVGRPEVAPHLRLELAGQRMEATSLVLLFLDDERRARYNASWHQPLSPDYLAAWWTREASSSRLLFMGHESPEDGDAVGFDVVSTRAGSYTLSWPQLEDARLSLPVTLVDNVTGDEVALDQVASYAFNLNVPAARPADLPRSETVPAPAETLTEGAAAATPRFTLHFGHYTTSTEGEADPSGDPLALTFINPARGTVMLRYTLPAMREARLEVFDLLGRRVALVEPGVQPAGTYAAPFETGGLSAGMYLVRLVAGRESVVHRMAVVR